jgi:hypothetical protein
VKVKAAAGVSALAVVGVFAAVASADTTPTPAPAADPAQMVISTTDLPGSSITSDRTFGAQAGGLVAEHDRYLKLSNPYGTSKVVKLASDVAVATDPATATDDYSKLAYFYVSPAGQKALEKDYVKTFASELHLKSTKSVTATYGKKTALSVPGVDQATAAGFLLKYGANRASVTLTVAVVDRVLVVNVSIGNAGLISYTDQANLLSLELAHIVPQMIPASTAAPTITGAPQQGQTLTAATGGWNEATTGFAYQWEDCDAAGANCTAIAGANQQTYILQPSDAGFTVEVQVTATNRFGTSTPVSSLPTTPVT